MEFLWLRDEQVKQMVDFAHEALPQESCGLIAGKGGEAIKIIPVANVATNPIVHYEMDQAALSFHLPALAKEGLDLIGFYHSHPKGDPLPSSTDIAQAHYPDTAYVIVGLKHPEPRIAAWLINYGQVSPLVLHIGSQPPRADDFEPDLSRNQKIAIILGAVLVFITLIVLSLMLLPPAPRI